MCWFMWRGSFNTQPPEGGWEGNLPNGGIDVVSTHSHPKVAGPQQQKAHQCQHRFNTQPPEGGWTWKR